MFVSRTLSNPVPPTVITSTDGKLKAFVKDAGVLLRADFNGYRPEAVLQTNFYPDPSCEYGLGVLGVGVVGSGTIGQDATHVHSGSNALKFLNTAPRTVSRTNLCKLPYYTGAGNWSNDGLGQTIGAGAVYQGRTAARVTSDGTAIRLGIRNIASNAAIYPNLAAGKTFWLSADIYVSANAVGNTITALTRDDPNNDSTASTILQTINTDNVKGGWTRFAMKFTVNAGRTITGIYLRGAAGAEPAGAYMDVDRVLIEETTVGSAAPSTYFDGGTVAADGFTYAWTGNANASTSTQLAQGASTTYISGGSVASAQDMGLEVGDEATLAVWVYIASGFTPYTTHAVELYGSAFADRVFVPYPNERDQWVRYVVTDVVTDASGLVQVRVYGGALSDDVMWLDDFMVIKGSADSIPDDFSGDTATSGDILYRWTGAPGASSSEQYAAFAARSKDSIQGPLISTGGVITLGGEDITDQLDFTFDGDMTTGEYFAHDWQDDAHTIALAQPLNPIEGVRFVRGDDLDSGILVRSGDDAVAPDGVAYAYDLEAPLGEASVWRAYPVYADGTVGVPTKTVAVVSGEPSGFYDTWFKSLDNPTLSRKVLLTKDNIPEFTYAARLTLQNPQGSPYPIGSRDVHTAPTATLTAYTQTTDEQDDMEALLQSGTLLFQTLTEYHLQDFYFEVGDFSMSLTGAGTALVSRKWTIPVTVVGRPTPLGTPLVVPGAAYDDLPAETYDALGNVWGSYDKLLEGMIA